MRDFTLTMYAALLEKLKEKEYCFLTFKDYCHLKQQNLLPQGRWAILRHDVDKKPLNALHMATLEQRLGVCASYYFRALPADVFPDYAPKIEQMGHEVGYHYEELATFNGDTEQSLSHFITQLSVMRQFCNVETICMHGSPRSRFDSKDLWKKYAYTDYGIVGEPYFDVDFKSVFYLTDTGRCWDGRRYSVRDKVEPNGERSYSTTQNLLDALQMECLPEHVMMTTHPQRWSDTPSEWVGELVAQTLKNRVKRLLIVMRNN